MTQSKLINLSSGAKKVAKQLINGKALAVSKSERDAYLVFDDYSFNKRIAYHDYEELKDKGLLMKIDSRIASFFYTLNDYAIKSIEL